MKPDKKTIKIMKKISYCLLCFAIVFSLVPANCLAGDLSYSRLAGGNRYQTACIIAQTGWDTSEYIILASGKNFPDALAATPLANYYKAPILLTEDNTLNSDTAVTIKDLAASKIIIIGGPKVISPEVENKLKSLGLNTSRIAGQDRYETSVKIAEELGKVYQISELAFVTGDHYANALSVASIAAGREMPMILVPKDNVPDSVKDYLSGLAVKKSYVIGNKANIGENVENQLPNPERVGGTDNYDTCLQVLSKFPENYTINNTILATGTNFADALAGTAFAAKLSAPVILTEPTANSGIKNWIGEKKESINKFYVLGGENALASSLINTYLGTGGNSGGETATFENSKFAFNYPGSWDEEEGVENNGEISVLLFNGETSAIMVYSAALEDDQTMDQVSDELINNFLKEYMESTLKENSPEGYTLVGKKDIIVDGIDAGCWDFSGETFMRICMFYKDKSMYMILFAAESSENNQDIAAFDTIVNSFKVK